MRQFKTLSLAAMLCCAPGAARAESAPTKVGQCADTAVKAVGFRLDGDADSGDFIVFTNGVSQVSYQKVPGLGGSRPNDRINLCLVSVPKRCPKGDTRGRVYKATNLRTGKTWKAANSSHDCGGT